MPSLFRLIKNGDLAGVQRAVQNDPVLLNATISTENVTPLMYAFHPESGVQPAVAQWLVKRGAKLDLQESRGFTALMFACRFDQPDTAQLLIERGAKTDLQNINGRTALMLACQIDRPDTAHLLIERGAKLDLQEKDGFTALMIVCLYNRPDTAQLLIERGAELDLQDNDGHTALMYACRIDQPDTAQLLIERGATLDLQDKDGHTALMIACQFDQPNTAQLLIGRGAKRDLQDNDGHTALMYACRIDQPDAQLLIELGATLGLQDNDGHTALMIACQYGQPETAQFLIDELGAEIDLRDNNGNTALMLACQQPLESHHSAVGRLRSLKLCYAAGADLDVTDKDGYDALANAKYFNRADAVAFLEFATASEVAGLLLGKLRQPRSLVVAFYEEGLVTKRRCSVLREVDLQGMGVTSSRRRRQILNEFNTSAAQVSRASLPRRASRRVVRVARRISGIYQYDAFLTHDWGENDANHDVVRSVNVKLRHKEKVTWFDGERLCGDIVQQITQGIENSRKVVVFVTERYMHKLQSDDEDYCKDEFLAATRVRKTRNMIAVIVDPAMLNTSLWRGPLQLKLGGHLYIDFTTPAKREQNFSFLLNRINE